ncbi:DMT family transporter [Oleispirillum naphthae]|uniref:DMT family transporter n=1 Tax=Oleispirillum naphthae TaxID=2838853 RepID=UPI0030825183
MSPSPLPAAQNSTKVGIAMMAASTLLFSILWIFVKILSDRYSVYEIAFFRNFFALIPATWMLLRHHAPGEILQVHRVSGHVWRAVLGVSAILLGFLSYHLMPLADAVAISFMSPLLVTALSVPLLGERVGIFRWSAVLVGFAGVMIIIQPGKGLITPGVLVALGAALFGALAQITIRQLNRRDHPLAIVFYFTVFATLLTALPLPFVWQAPQGWDWALMIAMGLAGGAGQYFLTRAFNLAPAAVISPFNYTSLLWTTIAGVVFWNTIPQLHVFVGAAIVVTSGLVILYRESRKGIPPLPPTTR